MRFPARWRSALLTGREIQTSYVEGKTFCIHSENVIQVKIKNLESKSRPKDNSCSENQIFSPRTRRKSNKEKKTSLKMGWRKWWVVEKNGKTKGHLQNEPTMLSELEVYGALGWSGKNRLTKINTRKVIKMAPQNLPWQIFKFSHFLLLVLNESKSEPKKI